MLKWFKNLKKKEKEEKIVKIPFTVSKITDTSVDTTVVLENNSIIECKCNKIICDICGREFSSKRGLSMHKTKMHK